MTFKELTQKLVNLAISLTNIGVKKGDIIGICCRNCMEYLPIVFGTLAAGATFTSVYYDHPRVLILHRLNLVKPKILFCSSTSYRTYRETFKVVTSIEKIIVLDEVIENTIFYKDFLIENVNVDEFLPTPVNGFEDVAMIMYSSGTTGMPKAVPMTHYNLLIPMIADSRYGNLVGMRKLINYQWHTSFGLGQTIYSLAAGIVAVYIQDTTDIEICLQVIEKYRINTFPLPPALLAKLVQLENLSKYDTSSLKYILTIGDACNGYLFKEIKKRIPSILLASQMYGLSEISILLSPFHSKDYDIKSVGGLVDMCVAKVVDIDTGEVLGAYQKGELCFKSPSLMKGYIGNTSEFLDEEGFLKSGDIGYYDDKKNFFIIDRIREIIKYNNFSVIPAELEAVLCTHPAVAEAGVVGAIQEDGNQLPTGFVVKRGDCTEDELLEYMKSQLPSYVWLAGGIRFVQSLPRGMLMKLDRKALKKMIANTN